MIAEGLCPSMMDNIIACVDCKIVMCHYLYSLNTKNFQLYHEHKNCFIFILMKIVMLL